MASKASNAERQKTVYQETETETQKEKKRKPQSSKATETKPNSLSITNQEDKSSFQQAKQTKSRRTHGY